jgi:hypothetical protein
MGVMNCNDNLKTVDRPNKKLVRADLQKSKMASQAPGHKRGHNPEAKKSTTKRGYSADKGAVKLSSTPTKLPSDFAD